MRYCLFTFLAVSLAFAQSDFGVYRPDLNGRLVDGNKLIVNPQGDKTEISSSMNGRSVPREVVETKILSQSPTGRVVETITRRYDPTGQPGVVTRSVTEEQTSGDKTTQRTTTYISDVNGRMQETERKTVESVKQGTTTSSSVAIARPGPSGSFDTIEKRQVVSVADKTSLHEDETIYRPVQNAGFAIAERQIRDVKKTAEDAPPSSTSTQLYRPGQTGQLELMTQETTTTTQRPDGSSVTERNIYGRATDGVSVSSDTGQRIRAQEVTVRRKVAGDGIAETTSLRETSPGDPTRLGAPRTVSETVCTGKCDQSTRP